MADEPVPADDTELDAARRMEVEERASAVDALLRGTKVKEAVRKALENPPVGTKDESIKDRNYATVAKAVAAVKDADIGAVLDVLDVDSCDVLMKYIYKGMEKLDNSPMWLKWHGPTLGKTGRSGIVRVFTDRKRV